jgi:hypothetical protein
MKNKILFVSLLAFISLFFISCEKEYSCEGCSGVLITSTATYSFNGGTNSCTGALVSGSYTAGTAVTAANTVVLNVMVDSVGTYAVTTNSVNGIFFSGSGVFTGTGSQTILLKASGTAVAAGNFNFTAGASGCSFTVTVAPVIDNSFTYFYEATIAGVFHKETVTTTNGFQAGSGVTGSNDVILSSNIIPSSYPPMPAGKTGMIVSKGILHNYIVSNNTEFITFFNLGDYSYTNTPSTTDGVSVSWYDESGTEWRSDNAPADQTGSSFKVVNVAPVTPSTIYTITVTFNFNCKLYDQSGNVKTLTNGIFKGEFEKQ